MLMATGTGCERAEAATTLRVPAVLAVSGGADSMVMASVLHAVGRGQLVALATFDHGTGAAASEAVALVRKWGAARGIPVHVGRASQLPNREAAWRDARWRFLRSVSASLQVPVATAHTEDDQVETVFIRLLRHSGVRGLAGLLAPGPVLRPMLGWTRAQVCAFAKRDDVPFRDDPSNADLRFLRNRARLEMLPAIEHSVPGFRAWLLTVGMRASVWRRDVAAAVEEHWCPEVRPGRGEVHVPRVGGRIPAADEAALFWPEVAGRVGVVLDRRGTARLASFTTKRESGMQMPLSGGATVTSSRNGWSLQRARALLDSADLANRLAPPEQ